MAYYQSIAGGAAGHYHDDHVMEFNGKQFPIYFYDQLEVLHKWQLQSRALNLKDALGQANMNIPAHKEHMVKWILDVQAQLTGKTPEDFGLPRGSSYHRSCSPLRPVSPPGRKVDRGQQAAPNGVPAYAMQQPQQPPYAVQDHMVSDGVAQEDAPGMHGHSKDDDYQGGLERGMGHGRHYIGATDHFVNSGMTANEMPGGHGSSIDDAYQGGMERGIGHGKRHIVAVDHMANFGTGVEDTPGAHGHEKDDDFQGGMERGIGHGRHYIGAVDHLNFGSEDAPGAHGHSKDDDFQGGMERGMGHGRHTVGAVDHDVVR